MVFSSVPVYLDPPNWHQQSNHIQQQGNDQISNHQLLPPLPPTNPHVVSGGAAAIRPGSMSDRARQAKIPQPEVALKCPRCESTNTKFCYFNNYSLSQPRHFCKTCRRYWTRGGALRNVPVGGGCRRNKKSKSGSITNSKSSGESSQSGTITSNESSIMLNTVIPSEMIVHPSTQLPFMNSLQNLTNQFGLNLSGFHTAGEIGGSNSGTTLTVPDHLGFHVANNNNNGGGLNIDTHHDIFSTGAGGASGEGGGGAARFPFFEPLSLLYPFQNNVSGGINHHNNPHQGQQLSSSMVDTRVSQMELPSVKMEESRSARFTGVSSSNTTNNDNTNNQYWSSGSNWATGLSGLNSSSSTNNHLI